MTACRDPMVYLKPWSSDYDKPPAEDQIRRSSVCSWGFDDCLSRSDGVFEALVK
jgi:hypothetical protein